MSVIEFKDIYNIHFWSSDIANFVEDEARGECDNFLWVCQVVKWLIDASVARCKKKDVINIC